MHWVSGALERERARRLADPRASAAAARWQCCAMRSRGSGRGLAMGARSASCERGRHVSAGCEGDVRGGLAGLSSCWMEADGYDHPRARSRGLTLAIAGGADARAGLRARWRCVSTAGRRPFCHCCRCSVVQPRNTPPQQRMYIGYVRALREFLALRLRFGLLCRRCARLLGGAAFFARAHNLPRPRGDALVWVSSRGNRRGRRVLWVARSLE